MNEPPPDLCVYRRTQEFSEDTIPAGLLRRHSTREGVWGHIVVLDGSLIYRELASGATMTLDPSKSAIAAPGVEHEVEARGPVRFYVEFMRRAAHGH